MLLSDTEHLALQAATYLVIAILLVGIADTPGYPIAIGIELIVILVLLMQHAPDLVGKLNALFTNAGLGSIKQ